MALTQKTIKVCKLSAPVLVKHSNLVTKSMYEKLYENYPESKLLVGGTQEEKERQFTMSIALFSNNIDAMKIVDKPVELGERKNINHHSTVEYTLKIKDSLLCAIKEVFGDAATDDIICAWKEAYYYMDDIVLEKESLFCKTA